MLGLAAALESLETLNNEVHEPKVIIIMTAILLLLIVHENCRLKLIRKLTSSTNTDTD